MLKDRAGDKRSLFALIFIVFLIALAIVVTVLISRSVYEKKLQKAEEAAPKVTAMTVSQKLERISELATEKLLYHGYIHHEEGTIPFINKKSYIMTYDAEVKAGVLVDEIEVTEEGDKIIVTIPNAKILSVYVDPESVEFFDERFAIFNWDSKQDGVDAIAEAEQNVRDNADMDSLLAEAYKNAKEIIEGVLQDDINEGRVEIR